MHHISAWTFDDVLRPQTSSIRHQSFGEKRSGKYAIVQPRNRNPSASV
jgi:hypothetical protein